MNHYFTNNENLKSEIRTIDFSHNGDVFQFYSDNGVFSKNSIDYGSRVLLDTFLKNENEFSSILDVGCGYGFLSIVIAKKYNAKVTGVDVNKRALHLAKMNAEKNKLDIDFIESNAYENIDEKYDIIITNPPVRAGKKVLLDILEGAKDHLNPSGRLYYVLRKDHGAKSMMEYLKKFYEIEELEKDKGFYIFRCKNH